MIHVYTDPNGVTHTWETLDPERESLDALGAAMTLLAVTGVLTVEDAANAVGLTPDDLTHEAQAWAAAGGDA
jgi:hypothetical protein